MKLLAIIIAFGLYHYVEKPAWLRDFSWVDQWQHKLTEAVESAAVRWLLVLALPLFLCWLLFVPIMGVTANSVMYFVLNIVILYVCLGPTTMVSEIDDESLHTALNISQDASPAAVTRAMTNAALYRWFGVFFWYVVLGVYGALAYRLACHVAKSDVRESFNQHALRVLSYPVTLLMTVSLALASDFEKVGKQAKQYISMETIRSMNSQFLYQSMDYAVENCEIESKDEGKAQITERTTYTVLKRMLVVWLVFVALLVLFTKG